jgi:uncharacterized membrane protein
MSAISALLYLIMGFTTSGAVAANLTFTPIDPPGTTFTEAADISDGGQIVGSFVDENGDFHGFLETIGVFGTIDVADGDTRPEGINSNGSKIVGSFDSTTLNVAEIMTTVGFSKRG